jgi:hypothetical protein
LLDRAGGDAVEIVNPFAGARRCEAGRDLPGCGLPPTFGRYVRYVADEPYVCLVRMPVHRGFWRGCSIPLASISSPTIEDYLDTRPDRCFLRRSAPSGRVPTRLTCLLVGAER